MLEPIESPQLYEQIVSRINKLVLTGVLVPGDRLPSERELAKQFNVGRAAVREALAALQNEQLVFTRQGAGSFLAEDCIERLVTRQELQAQDVSPVALLEARLILDPEIARLAAKKQAKDPEIEKLLETMENLTDIGDESQMILWGEADRLFHRQLAVLTGNALLVQWYESISLAMKQRLWRSLRDSGIFEMQRVKFYVAEHRMIYEAIVSGDVEASAFYARYHLIHVRRDMNLE